MLRRLGLFLLFLASGSSLVSAAQTRMVVAQDGSGTHSTIQSAIDAADPGSVIELKPGTYRESISIEKPITLRGANWNEVILTVPGSPTLAALRKELEQEAGGNPAQGFSPEAQAIFARFGLPLVKVKGVSGVSLSGIKIVHPTKGDKNRIFNIAVVDFDGSEGSVSDAAILGGPGNGVAIRNVSNLTISNCLVAAQWGTGVAIGGRNDTANRALIVDSELRNCYHRCVTIRSDRQVQVERCRISGSAWHGIRYDDSSPIISGSLIADNARSGIYASGRTSAEVQNNVFLGNALSAWSQNRDMIERNTFVCPERGGVDLIGGSRPTIRSNIFQGNYTALSQSGSQEEKPGGMPQLEDLRIKDNVFWKNQGVWRGVHDHKAAFDRVEGSILAKSGNVDADPGLSDLPNQFRPTADFAAKYPGVGSSAPFHSVRQRPLQSEERAIIPEGTNRDYKLWKNEE